MSSINIDLTGQRFGKLIALARLQDKENGYYLWDCVCDCGKRAQISTRKLKEGKMTDCGCIPKETAVRSQIRADITGQRFGLLTAVNRLETKNRKSRWMCVCDCGAKYVAETVRLKAGSTWHCGCMTRKTKNRARVDLRGRRIGRLTAIRATDKRDPKGSVIWECHCECGNVIEVSADCLLHGNYSSCGCRRREVMDSIRERLTFVDGTCIEWLRSRKHRSDNTSGFRGVSKSLSGKWRVMIGFKSKRYHIGTYDSFEEAKAVRIEVERTIHDGFIKAWGKWQMLAEADPDWAEKNPFTFEVDQFGGTITVDCPVLTRTEASVQTELMGKSEGKRT